MNAGSVIKYYKETQWDYKYLWNSRDTQAMHFGIYETGVNSHRQAVWRMNDFLAKLVAIAPGDYVVDAGCGLGGTSIWLARNYGCNVTGINIVPFQVDRASHIAQMQGVADKVNFVCEDYCRTSFLESSVDVFWGLESIVHASDKGAVVREAYRILKSGGRILISEYMIRQDPVLTYQEKEYLQPGLDAWVMPSLLTPQEYKYLLEQTGFKNVQTTDISIKVAPSLRRLKMLSALALPGAWVLKKLRFFSPERYANVHGSLRHANGFFKGLWQYVVITAEK